MGDHVALGDGVPGRALLVQAWRGTGWPAQRGEGGGWGSGAREARRLPSERQALGLLTSLPRPVGTLLPGDVAAGARAPLLGARWAPALCQAVGSARPPGDRTPPPAGPHAHALISMYSGVSPANGSSVKSASYRRLLLAYSSRSQGLWGFSRR